MPLLALRAAIEAGCCSTQQPAALARAQRRKRPIPSNGEYSTLPISLSYTGIEYIFLFCIMEIWIFDFYRSVSRSHHRNRRLQPPIVMVVLRIPSLGLIASLLFLMFHPWTVSAEHSPVPFLANTFKVGEVTSTEAIVWTRLSLHDGIPSERDAAPGVPGEVRLTYWQRENPDQKQTIDWMPVDSEKDYTLQIPLKSLQPDTRYALLVETRSGDHTKLGAVSDGSFQTAPDAVSVRPIKCVVVTCQTIASVDSGDAGFATYHYLDELRPDFFVHTGDIVYYDQTPLSKNLVEARQLWNRMFSYRFVRDFHRNTTSYFEKDDHDTVCDDCVPGTKFHDLTFEQGQSIFLEQVPMGKKTYRTFRWGKDLQIWLTENRDYRSHKNRAPDSPDKTILGLEQRNWLMKTMTESEATFKVLISPDCLVGPDKPRKADNHSNDAFLYEGTMLREFLASLPNTFVANGDRHWQYHSVDPKTGLNEFGCGPINDRHGNNGGNCGFQPEYHRFFCGGGGFLEITVERKELPTITFRHIGIDGIHATAATHPLRKINVSSGEPLANPEQKYPVLRYEVSFEAVQ